MIVRGCPGSLPPIGPACDDSATTASTLAGCITAPVQDTDVEPINLDTLARTIYDSDAPITDTGLRKCQAAISRQTRNYLGRRMKAVKKCEDRRARAVIPGPCPDASADAAIETARLKMDAGIRKFCSEAQLASTMPELKFGIPCESYKLVTYKRGPMNENTIPVQDRLIRCVTDAAAGVVDRMIDIPYVDPEADFGSGVAVGDGSPTGAIFWTRLPDSTMGAFLDVVLGADFTGPRVDARSDIYALGCLLFTVLTGRTPFRRDTAAATITAHLESPPPRASDHAGVPDEFDEVIARALEKDPERRYPSVGDLGRAAVAAAQGQITRDLGQSVARGEAAPLAETRKVVEDLPPTVKVALKENKKRSLWIEALV